MILSETSVNINSDESEWWESHQISPTSTTIRLVQPLWYNEYRPTDWYDQYNHQTGTTSAVPWVPTNGLARPVQYILLPTIITNQVRMLHLNRYVTFNTILQSFWLSNFKIVFILQIILTILASNWIEEFPNISLLT